MVKVFILALVTLFYGAANGQQMIGESLVGIWKLERSGFIEGGKESIKDFGPCRLSRNFVFQSDGTVEYTYYEGDLDTCYVSFPETYKWKMVKDTLILERSGSSGYYRVDMASQDELRMETINLEKRDTGDALTDRILNTIHFDVFRRQEIPVICEKCKVTLEQ